MPDIRTVITMYRVPQLQAATAVLDAAKLVQPLILNFPKTPVMKTIKECAKFAGCLAMPSVVAHLHPFQERVSVPTLVNWKANP